MKKLLIAVAAAGLLGTSAAQAFQLEFARTLCSLPAQELDDSVRGFQDKLVWVRRFETPASQYRKHIEKHSTELLDAFTAAQTHETCTTERKVRIQQFKTELERIYSRKRVATL